MNEHTRGNSGADDPRLTAYALGQMSGDEAARFEQEIEGDEAAHRAIAEIREVGALLGEGFARRPGRELSDEQRARVAAAAGGGRVVSMWRRPMQVAAAAVVVIGVGIAVVELQGSKTSPTVEPVDKTPVARASADDVPQARDDDRANTAPGPSLKLRIPPPAAEADEGEEEVAETPFLPVVDPAPLPVRAETTEPHRTDASGLGSPAESAPKPTPTEAPDAETLGTRRLLDWADPSARRPRTALGQEESDPVLRLKRVAEVQSESSRTSNEDFFMGLAVDERARGDKPSDELRRLERLRPEDGAFFNDGRDGAHRPLTENSFKLNYGTEAYAHIVENDFAAVTTAPLSTFSIDVDTASYANMRRFLRNGSFPPPDAIRIEELVNYFSYDYPSPRGSEHPFSIHLEVASCPWKTEHRLVRIGLRGKEIQALEPKARNLVFLIDVSGSMNSPQKLPLLKRSMRMLVEHLGEADRIAIVTYAGNSGCVLEPTFCEKKPAIVDAIEQLTPGGSTNGASGIRLAYDLAAKHFDPDGVNRVILATDGDFNVGISSDGELTRLIEEKRETGVFLSVLGFGTGNLQDSKMESLADHGNGNYAYIDSINEARKVLVNEMGATLVTIAKDVKIQIEFNPAQVQRYRLIGYENRALAARDFNDDKKDAGEIGAGHRVTAIYEVVPTALGAYAPGVDPLKYQTAPEPRPDAEASDEMLTVKLRYKQPTGTQSQLIEQPLTDEGGSFEQASTDFRFASAVASFGMLLRHSKHAGQSTISMVRDVAKGALGEDEFGYRTEFLELVDLAARKFKND